MLNFFFVYIRAIAASYLLNNIVNNMETSGDHGQSSTSHAQPIPAPNESNSAVSWASAFQSPEFMLGLQTAVSQALRQYNAPTDRVAQLESLGNPTQTATNSLCLSLLCLLTVV